jgi:hypothetical protein
MSNPTRLLVALVVLATPPLLAPDAALRAADGTSLAVASIGGGFETLEVAAGFRGVTWQETENPLSLRIAVP